MRKETKDGRTTYNLSDDEMRKIEEGGSGYAGLKTSNNTLEMTAGTTLQKTFEAYIKNDLKLTIDVVEKE